MAMDGSERPVAPTMQDVESTPSHVASRDLLIESTIIGETRYDLQSNAAIDDRVSGSGDAVSAVWTMSATTGSFDDRGTGYNHFDGTEWGAWPEERLESVRVGWPSSLQLGDGREVVVSHEASDNEIAPLRIMTSDIGSGVWTESTIPNGAVNADGDTIGNLWPRAAVGGLQNEIIHVICVTTPTGNGGLEYYGQNGALLYYRSMDAGESWEMHTFPELDSTHFTGFSGDTYAIHARGTHVAFAVFNNLDDSFVMSSNDVGDNWEYHTMVDFPVDLYEIDQGLPDSLAFDYDGDGVAAEYFTSDGAGDIHIDVNDQIHCVFGAMVVADDDTTDGVYSYFPTINGLEYWRSDFEADSSITIGYALDFNDDSLDFIGYGDYGVGLAAIPSMASDEDGNLYVSFSAIVENWDTGTQNFRHIYLVHSTDEGETWNSDSPCDLTPDSDLEGLECVFASIGPDVADHLEIIYQQDYEPGLHVRGDEDPVTNNDIVHLRVAVADLGDCAAPRNPVVVDEPFAFGQVQLFPNPASTTVEIVIDRPGAHEVRVFDMEGRQHKAWTTTEMVERMDVRDLTPGIYFVELSQGLHRTVERLAIQ
jgi:hypothetical protein